MYAGFCILGEDRILKKNVSSKKLAFTKIKIMFNKNKQTSVRFIVNKLGGKRSRKGRKCTVINTTATKIAPT